MDAPLMPPSLKSQNVHVPLNTISSRVLPMASFSTFLGVLLSTLCLRPWGGFTRLSRSETGGSFRTESPIWVWAFTKHGATSPVRWASTRASVPTSLIILSFMQRYPSIGSNSSPQTMVPDMISSSGTLVIMSLFIDIYCVICNL